MGQPPYEDCPGCGREIDDCEMTTPACPQRRCCPHQTRIECACPQGYRSHAMAEGEDECQCGKIKIAEAVWQNCSGQTHVFQPDAAKCGCGQRSAGVERVSPC